MSLKIKPATNTITPDTGKAWRSVLVVFCLATAPVAGSQTTIYLRAQHIEVDQKSGLSTYRGKVHLQRGDLSFSADKATVRQNNSGIESLTAFGNPVVIRTRNRKTSLLTTITGQQLEYLAKTNRVVITGNVITRQGNDVISSSKVIYYVDDDHIVAKNDNKSTRVKAVFQLKRLTGSTAPAQTNTTQ